MSTDNNISEKSWIYQDGPSKEDIKIKSQYRKTRNYYGFLMQKGRMLQLQDLEDFPAPIACPCCEKPVITTVSKERTGRQWSHIIFMTIASLGCFTYLTLKLLVTFVHTCPSCHNRIAESNVDPTDVAHRFKARVLRGYDSPDGKPAENLYTTNHILGGVYYQWNNNNSKIGNQAGEIGTQHQRNDFAADTVQDI